MSKGIRADEVVCEIETTAPLTFAATLRANTPVEEEQLKKYIDKNLKRGYIRPSTARNSVGIIWAKKKGTDELRPCQNYKPLNAITKKYIHAPPPAQAYRSKITRFAWYAKYDIEEAYTSTSKCENPTYGKLPSAATSAHSSAHGCHSDYKTHQDTSRSLLNTSSADTWEETLRYIWTIHWCGLTPRKN
jgi:hypothetical protein